MAEVFGLHSSLHFKGQVLVHLQKHVSHGYVLVSVTILVSHQAEGERDELAGVVRSSASEVRVNNNRSEGSRAERVHPLLIVKHLLPSDITLEVIVEAMVLFVPLHVVFEVLVAQEVIGLVSDQVASHVVLSKNI